MIVKGTVVEIRKDNKNQVGICIDCKLDKVRLLLYNNKEVTIPSDKTYFPSEYILDVKMPREELVKSLKNIDSTRENLKSDLPLEDLWQLLNEDGGIFSPKDIAELNFGKEFTSDHLSAVFRALSEDNIFFKNKKNGFITNSADNVKQILDMVRIETEKKEKNRKIIQWIKNVWQENKDIIADRELDGFIEKLKYVAVNKIEGKSHRAVSELLKEASVSGHNVPFRLLVKSGIWDEDENLDIYEYEIPTKFDGPALAEVEKIIDSYEVNGEGREDLSELYTFTIDNEDTEDMDDALSIEKTAGGYKIGIHITDVAEFIAPDSVLDNEAKARYTSIYMPEKRIGMLPNELANELFSLVKDNLRPSLSVIVNLDNNYNIINYEVKETIIKVKDRLTYEEADGLISRDERFITLYNVSEKIRDRRKLGKGKFFYIPELEITVNEKKEIKIKIYDRETPAHKMVSELMILANELCARYCRDNNIPIIYRSQPEIDEGFTITEEYDPLVFFQQRKLLKKSETTVTPEYHHSLGVEVYTQMTSPIRRYSDLIVHRQMKSFLRKNVPFYTKEELQELIMLSDGILDVAGSITRKRKRYWLLKHLKTMVNEPLVALVLQNNGDKAILMLRNCFLEFSCNANHNIFPGEEVDVKIESVNPREDIIKVSILDRNDGI